MNTQVTIRVVQYSFSQYKNYKTMFWYLIDRTRRTILHSKNTRNHKIVLVSNRPLASHDTSFFKNTKIMKMFGVNPTACVA